MSLPSDRGQESLPVGNLSSTDCGKCPGVAYGTVPIGSSISINNSVDLHSCIVGPDGAYVSTITYESVKRPVRPGTLYVYGRGPSTRGSLLLTFATPNEPQGHTVHVHGSSPDWFSDEFEDVSPISSISWQYDS